jgi:hypothetical protein
MRFNAREDASCARPTGTRTPPRLPTRTRAQEGEGCIMQVAAERVQPLLLARGQHVLPLARLSSACLGRRLVRLDRHTLLHRGFITIEPLVRANSKEVEL